MQSPRLCIVAFDSRPGRLVNASCWAFGATGADPADGARRVADAMGAALPLAGSDVYVAGPARFVAAITVALRAEGVPAPQIFSLVI